MLTKTLTHSKKQNGFTVVEMIVVISIFGIITGVLLFNYRNFQKFTDFKLFMQEIALVVKAQQQSAMSGVITINPQEKTYPDLTWRPSYGVYVESNTNKLITFYDYNQNGTYESFGLPCRNINSECLQEMSFTEDRLVGSICAGTIDDTTYYQTGILNCGSTYSNLSVLFKRPFPDAIFRANYNPANYVEGNPAGIPILTSVEIPIQSVVGGALQVITINPVGAIFTRTITN